MSALHRFLVEFDLGGSNPPRGAWPLLGRHSSPPLAEVSLEPEMPDIVAEPAGGTLSEADVADRVAEAVAAAVADAEAAHATALAAAAERHAADLAEARLRWATEEGQVLAEGVQAALAMLEQALAEGAGAALEPLMSETLRDAAVTELRRAVADLVLSGTGGRIAVAGPADLVEALQVALAEAGVESAALEFTAAETAEVSVTSDASTIETRLGAWARTLQGRLGGEA